MPRFLHATALALVMLCPIGAGAQQSQPDQMRQGPPAQETRADALNTAKQRLKLTPEQEQLWGRVDEALRKLRAGVQEARDAARAGDGMTGDTMERLRRRADYATRRAETWRTLAEAVQPLWGMLTDDQKRDFSDLVRLAARGEEPRMSRRDRDDRDDRGERGGDRGDRSDRGIQREGRGDYEGPRRHGDSHRDRGHMMDRRDHDPDRRYGRDQDDDDDDGRDRYDGRRYGGRHDRYDPWIMRRERGWDDLYRDHGRRFEPRRGWRADPENGCGMGRDRFERRGGREWGDRPYHDRGGYDRRGDRFEDDQD